MCYSCSRLIMFLFLFDLFFFFSSRRRHTRYIGDWSSDVCSSDLADLNKIDIRVGTILTVEDVDGSDKLVKLTVTFGNHQRTILAGMKQERKNPKEIGRASCRERVKKWEGEGVCEKKRCREERRWR